MKSLLSTKKVLGALISAFTWLPFLSFSIDVTSIPTSSAPGGIGTGSGWQATTTNNVQTLDGTSATTNGNLLPTTFTDRMVITGFDFTAVPANAIIEGIEVRITRRNSSASSDISDNTVQLSLGGTNLGINTAWPNTLTEVIYGGSSILWGNTLTRTDIVAPTFGVDIVAHRAGVNNTLNIQRPEVDFVYMTVSYSVPLPIELISFKATLGEGRNVDLQWVTGTETNTESFVIEKSLDGESFTPIAYETAAGYSFTSLVYSHVDRDLNASHLIYYQLRQRDQDGKEQLYGPISVLAKHNKEITAFPNPASDFINLQIPEESPYSIHILSADGKLVKYLEETTSLSSVQIPVHDLKDGAYLILLKNAEEEYQKIPFYKQ